MTTDGTAYPLRFDVDYPDEGQDRLRTAFGLILLIPMAVVLWAINGLLFPGPLLMILFRRKYPRW